MRGSITPFSEKDECVTEASEPSRRLLQPPLPLLAASPGITHQTVVRRREGYPLAKDLFGHPLPWRRPFPIFEVLPR